MYPEIETKCATIRDLRHHMRKLWAAVRQGERGGVDAVFFQEAKMCRSKSVVLAKRMRVHAKGCSVCKNEHALDEEYFYGVYPL